MTRVERHWAASPPGTTRTAFVEAASGRGTGTCANRIYLRQHRRPAGSISVASSRDGHGLPRDCSCRDLDLGVDQPRRLTNESKASTKTTELYVFVATVLAVVATANVYDGSTGDPFGATTAMRYVVYLAIAYLLARGLAKSGSRDHYDA